MPASKVNSIAALTFQTFAITLSEHAPNGKYIIVIADGNSPRNYYASNVFCVKPENRKLMKIYYRNSQNLGDIWYGRPGV